MSSFMRPNAGTMCERFSFLDLMIPQWPRPQPTPTCRPFSEGYFMSYINPANKCTCNRIESGKHEIDPTTGRGQDADEYYDDDDDDRLNPKSRGESY